MLEICLTMLNSYYHIDFDLANPTKQTRGRLNRKGMLCSESLVLLCMHYFGNQCIKCCGSIYSLWALYLYPITVFILLSSSLTIMLHHLPSLHLHCTVNCLSS